jgi:hypothetical protein
MFGRVFGAGLAEHERTQAVGRHRDALDSIGGFDALHHGHRSQGFDQPWRLAGEKLLLALELRNVREEPDRALRQRQLGQTFVAERVHRARLRLGPDSTPEAQRGKLRCILVSTPG